MFIDLLKRSDRLKSREGQRVERVNPPRRPPDELQGMILKYLEICNAAVGNARDSRTDRALQNLITKVEGRKLGMRICARPGKRTPCLFAVQVSRGRFRFAGNRRDHQTHSVPMTADYLEQVISNPEDYTLNPARLDWTWLRSGAVEVLNRLVA